MVRWSNKLNGNMAEETFQSTTNRDKDASKLQLQMIAKYVV